MRVTYDDMKALIVDKVSKHELHFLLKDSVRQNEFKQVCDAVNDIEDQLRIRLEEIQREVNKKGHSVSAHSQQPSTDVKNYIEQRLAEIDEKLQDKANKQSVAQALHRKANRVDVEAELVRKSDITEIQRITALLEQKVD